MKTQSIPCPRFEFLWIRPLDEQKSWRCLYSLVIPLSKYDIRRGEDDKSELSMGIGETKVGLSGGGTPIEADGSVMTPFRDGAHAQWDCKSLGGHIPIVSIFEDSVFVVPYMAKQQIDGIEAD